MGWQARVTLLFFRETPLLGVLPQVSPPKALSLRTLSSPRLCQAEGRPPWVRQLWGAAASLLVEPALLQEAPVSSAEGPEKSSAQDARAMHGATSQKRKRHRVHV